MDILVILCSFTDLRRLSYLHFLPLSFLGFEVTRSGSCAGYSWEVEWKRLGGDLPEIGVDGLRLHGSDVEVSTSTLVDGGVWFKPLRGDMTRVPKQSPQVNKITPQAQVIL